MLCEYTSTGTRTLPLQTHVPVIDPKTRFGVAAPRPVPSFQRPPPFSLRSVAVLLDGTPAAEYALPHAAGLARASGAELVLVNVYRLKQVPRKPERFRGAEGQPQEPLRGYLDALAERAEAAFQVRVRSVSLPALRPGDALAGLDWADLLVVAAGRREGWSRLWRSSVRERIARQSATPVLFIPAGTGLPDLIPVSAAQRILLPLDRADDSEQVLGPVAALASSLNATCELLHVVPAHSYTLNWSHAYGARPTCLPVREMREGHQYLLGVAEQLLVRGVDARWQVVADEQPTAKAIARYAARSGVDAIAMINRGGSTRTAERVARLAGVPVLMCRSR